MEPEVIGEEIEMGFRVSNVPQVNIDKLLGLWSALTTDYVHTQASVFINTCNALSGTPVDINNFDPADPYEIAWGLTELTFLDATTPKRLSSDVKRYIGETCKAFGLYRPPPVIADVADFGGNNYVSNAESHADTPEAIQEMTRKQQEYSDDIRDYISQKTNTLIVELHNLPLIHKDTDKWLQFVKNFAKELT